MGLAARPGRGVPAVHDAHGTRRNRRIRGTPDRNRRLGVAAGVGAADRSRRKPPPAPAPTGVLPGPLLPGTCRRSAGRSAAHRFHTNHRRRSTYAVFSGVSFECRLTGARTDPPETSSPEVCSFQLPQVCSFRLLLTSPAAPSSAPPRRAGSPPAGARPRPLRPAPGRNLPLVVHAAQEGVSVHPFQHEPDLASGLGREVDPCALVGIDCQPVQRRLIPRPVSRRPHVPQNRLEVLGHGRPIAGRGPRPQPPGRPPRSAALGPASRTRVPPAGRRPLPVPAAAAVPARAPASGRRLPPGARAPPSRRPTPLPLGRYQPVRDPLRVNGRSADLLRVVLQRLDPRADVRGPVPRLVPDAEPLAGIIAAISAHSSSRA